jgi:hypothetical protein
MLNWMGGYRKVIVPVCQSSSNISGQEYCGIVVMIIGGQTWAGLWWWWFVVCAELDEWWGKNEGDALELCVPLQAPPTLWHTAFL